MGRFLLPRISILLQFRQLHNFQFFLGLFLVSQINHTITRDGHVPLLERSRARVVHVIHVPAPAGHRHAHSPGFRVAAAVVFVAASATAAAGFWRAFLIFGSVF